MMLQPLILTDAEIYWHSGGKSPRPAPAKAKRRERTLASALEGATATPSPVTYKQTLTLSENSERQSGWYTYLVKHHWIEGLL